MTHGHFPDNHVVMVPFACYLGAAPVPVVAPEALVESTFALANAVTLVHSALVFLVFVLCEGAQGHGP
jgi:hypothetical protein